MDGSNSAGGTVDNPPGTPPPTARDRAPQQVVDAAPDHSTLAEPWRAGRQIVPLAPATRPPRGTRWLTWLAVGMVLLVGGVAVGRALMVWTTNAHSGWPSPGFEAASEPLSAPPEVPPHGEGRYEFLNTTNDSAPVTFSPCRPIHYVVRPDQAPAGGLDLIQEAVATASAATGLAFVYDGHTAETPRPHRTPYQPERYGDRWAPVLFAWATHAEFPDFGVDTLGRAEPIMVTQGPGQSAYVTGSVVLDPVKLGQLRRAAGAPAARAIVLHELGHLLGLAHVSDSGQLMYPRALSNARGYRSGDLAGLAHLGSGPCRPDL